MDNKSEILKHAAVLWDYLELNQDLKPASFILTLGNKYMKHCAEKSAQLYHDGYGAFIIVTGGVKHSVVYKGKKITESEAQILYLHLIDLGVPSDKIIIEDHARTTGCNFLKTLSLLEEFNIHARDLIAVTKPYIERRALATSNRQTPSFQTQVASFDETLESFYNQFDKHGQDDLINELVGTINRMHDYPHLGYQTFHPVPDHVEHAKKALERLGYPGNYRLNNERKRAISKTKKSCPS